VSDAHLGVVRFSFEGRATPLRFTLRRLTIGWGGTVELMQASLTEGPQALSAVADLMVMASGGEISRDDVLDRFSGLDFERALVALHEAWALFRFGPSMKPPEGSANPLNRLWTSLRTFWRRLTRRT
jgi:hypothetical protein